MTVVIVLINSTNNDELEIVSVSNINDGIVLEDLKQISNLNSNEQFVILNIWASWCAPCREEHSQLMELSKNSSLKIIGLNYKDNPKKAEKFLKELGNPFSTIIVDKNGIIAIEFGGYGIPETFLINKDKKIIKTYVGNLTDDSVKQINLLTK